MSVATPRAYRWIVGFFRLLMRIFFRRIEVTGLEHLPETGGGLVISWHPNGLIDPGLILTRFPRRIFFGARHGLFRWPVLGTLMRALGTVPIYRRVDAGSTAGDAERRAANRRSLDAMAQAIADGSFAALFPEGTSHDEPYPLELRSGAARLFYHARELTAEGAPGPVILPVGLHYDKKGIFGSSVLVAFHPPLRLPPELAAPLPAEASEEVWRERCVQLTAELDRVLREVVHATESWELHHLMHRARKLIRAERAARAGAAPGRPDMMERVLGYARLWSATRIRLRSHPQESQELMERVRGYDHEITALGMEDHELDGNPRLGSTWVPVLLALQAILVYLLLPPILIVGYLVNLPTALLLLAVAKASAQAYKDEATVKVLLGAVAFPLTWLVAALLVAWGQTSLSGLYPRMPEAPLLTGAVAFLLSGLGGLVALHYHRLAAETARSLRVRLTRLRRQGAIARLREQRAELHGELLRMAEGLELPGAVAPDGRVVMAAPRAGQPSLDPTPEGG